MGRFFAVFGDYRRLLTEFDMMVCLHYYKVGDLVDEFTIKIVTRMDGAPYYSLQ